MNGVLSLNVNGMAYQPQLKEYKTSMHSAINHCFGMIATLTRLHHSHCPFIRVDFSR